jgi:hypothetical protein
MARGNKSSEGRAARSESNQYGSSDFTSRERASQGGPAVTTSIVERDFRIIKKNNDGSTGGWTPKSAGKEARSLAISYIKEAYKERSKYADAMNGEVPDSPYVMDALDALQKSGTKWILENRQPSGQESKEYVDIIKRAIEAVDYQTKQDIRDMLG